MSLFTLFGLSALLNIYMGARLLPDLAAFPAAQYVLAAVLVLCALVMPLALWPPGASHSRRCPMP